MTGDPYRLPALVCHADWSKDPAKRWVATARLDGACYRVVTVCPAGPVAEWLESLLAPTAAGPVLVGFDFPIGVPAAYAEKAGISRFPVALLEFGFDEWVQFYEPARTAGQISVHRPFYPAAPGGTRRLHLLEGLDLDRTDQLYRACETVPGRTRANSLFWTLGAKQVGRAAISGWREFVGPALRRDDRKVALWPYDGDLPDLLGAHHLVLAETYPADAYDQIWPDRPTRRWSKRKQADRLTWRDHLLSLEGPRTLEFDATVRTLITEGFEDDDVGEDRFDALAGLLGMLQVLRDADLAKCPTSDRVRHVEGWILGRPAPEG